jgi:hypothetical protein
MFRWRDLLPRRRANVRAPVDPAAQTDARRGSDGVGAPAEAEQAGQPLEAPAELPAAEPHAAAAEAEQAGQPLEAAAELPAAEPHAAAAEADQAGQPLEATAEPPAAEPHAAAAEADQAGQPLEAAAEPPAAEPHAAATEADQAGQPLEAAAEPPAAEPHAAAAEADQAGQPLEAPAEPPTAETLRARHWLHDHLPYAIVAVSILAAMMGWRASLADEGSAHTDELSRQDLVRQQAIVLQDIQTVDSDVRLFGPFEENSLLSAALRTDAAKITGSEAQSLSREAQARLELARSFGDELQLQYFTPADPANTGPYGDLRSDGTYKPGHPYDVKGAIAISGTINADLTSLEPDRLRTEARSERLRGVHLIGLATLFVAALVFFTLAAVSRGQVVAWFTASGAVVALIALVLFPIIELS